MPCPDDQTLVRFADDELDMAQRRTVEQHLAGCTSCDAFVEEIRSLVALGRSSLQAIHVPFRKVRSAAPRTDRARRMLAFASLAAAAVFLVVSIRWIATKEAEGPTPQSASLGFAEKSAIPPLLDEAFERWAESHRQRRIPLIPMEEVVHFNPPLVLPIDPTSDEPVPRS